jgi:hypothetical protein
MKHTRLYLLLLLLFFGTSVSAQTAAAEFRLVNEAYAKAKTLSMDVQYKLYANYTTASAYESSQGKFIRQNDKYYSSLLGITTIQNDNYKISIQDESKTIIVTNPLDQGRAPSLPQLDTVLKRCSSTEIQSLEQGKKRYVLNFEKMAFSEFDRMEIEIDASHFVTKLVLFYRDAVSLDETNTVLKKEKPRLEISYSSINTHPVISEQQFSEKKYFTASKKQLILTSTYSAYQLLNYKN